MINFIYNKKSGFTLAEILITLGVIGIIASMILLTLIQKQQEQQTIVSLKKIYSNLSSAYTSAIDEYGSPENWGMIDTDMSQSSVNMLNSLASFFKITKNCGASPGCFNNINYKHLSGADFGDIENTNTYAKAILSDGSKIFLTTLSTKCDTVKGWDSIPLANVCANIYVDINGDKKPNVFGKDLFSFYATKYNLIPVGTANAFMRIDTSCNKTNPNWGCTAWVIYNENMDYLYCPGTLYWGGPTKCQ